MKSISKKNKTTTTRKKYYTKIPKVSGTIIEKTHGWVVAEIRGDAYERGYAHGVLLYKELRRIVKSLPFIVKKYFKTSLSNYIKVCKQEVKQVIKNDFPEIYEEMRGISHGAKKMGIHFSVDALIAWNSAFGMGPFFENESKEKMERCSAFIATGDSTQNGEIVMAHNTHTDFLTGQLMNVIMYVYPSSGNHFVMQISPGYVASGSDWFLCSTGIIGCESTIGGTEYKPKFGSPFFCRIRQAMQYGKTLDEYVEIMLKNNAGDYACSWLFGDINTNEIMQFEIGLDKHNLNRTNNGLFYGMNSAFSFDLNNTETTDTDFHDFSTSSGSRNYRLDALLNNVYSGKINTDNAKTVISDHYDVFLNKEIMNGRSICNHAEKDEHGSTRRDAFYPRGCTDGKVVNSKMAKNLEFEGRFGSACGRIFNVKNHFKLHPEHKEWEPYLENIDNEPWVSIRPLVKIHP
jgi:hypothetical protein